MLNGHQFLKLFLNLSIASYIYQPFFNCSTNIFTEYTY